MAVELTKEIMERAFDAVGLQAAAQGIVIHVAVFGGSCRILASDIRNSSGDVDAVFLSGGEAVRKSLRKSPTRWDCQKIGSTRGLSTMHIRPEIRGRIFFPSANTPEVARPRSDFG